jgi:hypothetical protein
MTKERPIIFSAPMVRAILEGRKTQTRHVCKPQPVYVSDCGDRFYDGCDYKKSWCKPNAGFIDCPFGNIGDRLWVKETFGVFDCDREPYDNSISWAYKATPYILEPDEETYSDDLITLDDLVDKEWRSPIYMPRIASRITLEITNIRVERLQDISDKDALAKGIENFFGVTYNGRFPPADGRLRFSEMWESTQDKNPWNTNPWVWVIEFKRCAEQ